MKAMFAKLDKAMPYTGPMLASACGVSDAEEQTEDPHLGYMEYFDWLAGCSDAELFKLAETHDVKCLPTSYPEPLTPEQRDALGRALWSVM